MTVTFTITHELWQEALKRCEAGEERVKTCVVALCLQKPGYDVAMGYNFACFCHPALGRGMQNIRVPEDVTRCVNAFDARQDPPVPLPYTFTLELPDCLKEEVTL